jgi:hypothetical protein
VALVEEDALDDALDGLVDRGVVEDDVRRLAVEPVKAILSTGARTSAEPAVPSPGTTLSTPSGSSASWAISANRSAVSGVVSAGLRTEVFPHASAGATFHAAMSSGKFHGTIWPATPCGAWSRPPTPWRSLSAHPA